MNSLGLDVLRWASRVLPSPSDPSQPFRATDEQAKFFIEWYALDAVGDYVYRRGAIEAAKGWGKSPIGAVWCIAEFACPLLRRKSNAPYVQIAGVAEDSAISNVYVVIWQLLSENDGKAARELGIDLGRTRLYLKDVPGAKLEAVTSAAGTREGQRITAALLDETQSWTKSNGGHRLARTIRRNAGKMDGRTLEMANAPEIGELSIAELTQSDAGAPGVLYVARRPDPEPHPEASDPELLALLEQVYEGAPWVDTRRILREVRDPGTPWPESLRFYFNVPSTGSMAAVDPAVWGARYRRRSLDELRGLRWALGFDGSHAGDATALVASAEDGWQFPVLIVERPEDADETWRVERSLFHDAIADCFDRLDVRYLYADPWQWQSELEEWSRIYGEKRVVEVPTNSVRKMAPIVDRWRTAIREDDLSHDGDPDLARHVLNARLRLAGRDEDGRGVYTLEKAGPGRWIDGAVASSLAFEGSQQILGLRRDPNPLVARL